MRPSPHAGPLEALGVGEPARGRLCRYLDALAEWAPRVNLTGARTPGERAVLLVGEVLAAAALPRPGRLIDIGSGNGSPGLVFALLRGDLEVTLLEPRQKRWAFLREAVRRAEGPRVRVERCRHDGYLGPSAETVCSRALVVPLGELDGLVLPGGRILVLGGNPQAEGSFSRVPSREGVPDGVWVFERLGPRGAS